MPASEAKIRANQANSLKSRGPRSPEGKLRSRANALKHGLCSEVVGVEAPQAVPGRAEAPAAGASPIWGFEDWLVDQVATLGRRVELAQSMQEATRERIALRAELAWEDDRRLEATVLGGQLDRRPDQVVERLRQTPQGCEWLISRWAMLAHAADRGQGWTPEQTRLAFDLLGTPGEFREGIEPGAEIDADGRSTGAAIDGAALARREVDELQRRIEIVLELDAADRRRAKAGLADDAELRRFRRYETDLRRRLRWTLGLLQGSPTPQSPPSPDLEPEPEPEPEPRADEARDRAVTDPKVRPTVEAVGQPTGSSTRAEKKLWKAEARREARVRKLDKRRA